jgi:serine protease Do
MQRHVQLLSERVLPASVGVQVGAAQGSGVIISPQGYVLTAAHVIGKAGRKAQIYLPSGRPVPAITLGTFRTMDAGLLKIELPPGGTSPEAWPHVPMGDSSQATLGQWCLAIGHPGGIQNGRQPSVRLGRILSINPANALSTDCTLIGGDSGGPLFDMQGKVIGVHSRIGGPLTANLHVPVNTYHEYWARLERGDNWGYTPGNRPYIGVLGLADSPVTKLTRVVPKSPAEQAGLRVDDVVLTFSGQPVRDFASLRSYVEDQEPGARVAMEVLRGEQRLTLEIVIGRLRE